MTRYSIPPETSSWSAKDYPKWTSRIEHNEEHDCLDAELFEALDDLLVLTYTKFEKNRREELESNH
jgi:hypothetical protein